MRLLALKLNPSLPDLEPDALALLASTPAASSSGISFGPLSSTLAAAGERVKAGQPVVVLNLALIINRLRARLAEHWQRRTYWPAQDTQTP